MPSAEEQKEVMGRQPELSQQSLDGFDPNTLTPLSEDVISRQATVNIGTIGHVAHGKSTVVKAVTGINPVKTSKEKKRNITIKLGYANAKIFKCPTCPPPQCFIPAMFNTEDAMRCKVEGCESICKLVRHISFVDCPGHDLLMATMITGASVMDCALLLIAANETCPQPQTSEHLASIEIMKLDHIIILQNKIDIIMKDGTASQQYDQIKDFVQGTKAEKSPIIPISAQLGYNIDVLCDYICRIPIPIRDFTCPPKMSIVRSFDINKPGCSPSDLQGGVVGGSLLSGVLRVGEKVEIRPGMSGKDKNTGKRKCTSIMSRIVSLKAEQNDLLYAVPGGLVAVGLKCDPSLTRDDHLNGQFLGHPNKLPEVVEEVVIKFYLLRRLLGVVSDNTKKEKVSSLKKEEILLINISANSVGGKVIEKKKSMAKIQFLMPACASVGDKITLSRKIVKNWRLIGWGEIDKVTKVQQ
ncbi:unnamed protein product [Moneuplotes crassus]|uniref:protein-synthesizing GTPase n=2 Tax=Euplotes crassus TaxID=5936 RepID=A0AAD1XCW5_EUPCR|nr:unnamed protein product [Moneuplotes crassus]